MSASDYYETGILLIVLGLLLLVSIPTAIHILLKRIIDKGDFQ